MILHMAVRHCHTQHFIEDQIDFVNCLFGEQTLDISYYVFKTLFTPSVKMIKHYLCMDCEFYLGEDDDFMRPECSQCESIIHKTSCAFVVCIDCRFCLGPSEDFSDCNVVECPKCMKEVDINAKIPEDSAVCLNCNFLLTSKEKFLKRVKFCECLKCHKQVDVSSVASGNYFIAFSLQEQIEALLSKKDLKFVSRDNRNLNYIGDMCDGGFYRNLMKPGFPLANENALTVTFNTDGIDVQESTKTTLWPIWLLINEITPEQRFKQENLILGGLWFGKSAPNMSLFMQPFVNQLVDLSVNGGVVRTLPCGSIVKCPVYPLSCSLDSVAKPKLVCQKQFNGKMGCLYCYHPNDTTIGGNNTQRFYDQTITYKLRTDEEVIRDMFEADSLQREGKLKKSSVNGFVGISVLLTFSDLLDVLTCNTFSIVWGVAIDYMHSALEGVTADLFNIIANILTSEQLDVLNEYFNKITPPQAMTRRPRSFTLRSYWKAKEYRTVLLYYILPCLERLLADKYFNNLKLFVHALHILLSDTITSAQISNAASYLSRFAVGYQRLYGIVNVSYNLHICRHFPELVERYGPLWSYSNFVFESGNGYLLNLVRGTKSVVNEVAVKHTTIQTASELMTENYASSEALEFCSKILRHRYLKKEEVFNGEPMATSYFSGQVSDDEAAILIERNVTLSGNNTVVFINRVIRDGIVYCSKSYSRAKEHDDSCVMLVDGTFATIDKLLKSASNEILCLIKPIRIAQGEEIIPPIKRCCVNIYDGSKVVPFSDVHRKCFLVSVDERNFICTIPNFYERD